MYLHLGYCCCDVCTEADWLERGGECRWVDDWYDTSGGGANSAAASPPL